MQKIKDLEKLLNKAIEIKTDLVNDTLLKHNLFIDNKRVDFLYESLVQSNFDKKDNQAINNLVNKYYHKINDEKTA